MDWVNVREGSMSGQKIVTREEDWCLVSSVTFPFIRSIKSSYIFSVPVATRPGAPPTWKRGKLAGQPTRPAGLLTIRHAHSPYTTPKRKRHYGNGATERHYGHGLTETVMETDTDERKRNAGNHA